jgi:hypothetical protein
MWSHSATTIPCPVNKEIVRLFLGTSCGRRRDGAKQLPDADKRQLQRLVTAHEDQAMCLWNAIDLGDVEIHVNQMTLDAVYSAVPPKMVGSIAATSTGNNEHTRYMRDLRAVARRDIWEHLEGGVNRWSCKILTYSHKTC